MEVIQERELLRPLEEDEEPRTPPIPDGLRARRSVLGRLHLKIGRVIHVEDHTTDPDMFYFEYIEAGDRVSQCFVRGLNKFYTAEDFTTLRVVLLYIAMPHWVNTQESKLISVLSAHTLDGSRAELLIPPVYTQPGDLVTVKGHINSAPPPSKLTLPFHAPVEELLFRVMPYFGVDQNGVATYKRVPLEVKGKGVVISEHLTNCPVR